MISKLGQVMLYVNNQEESLKFWTEKLGFVLMSEADDGQGMKWYELAPSRAAEASIVLQNKELVARMEPDLNLGTPSLMFQAFDLNQLHSEFTSKNITVGDIVEIPSGSRVFNFADNEDNYFAVMEIS